MNLNDYLKADLLDNNNTTQSPSLSSLSSSSSSTTSNIINKFQSEQNEKDKPNPYFRYKSNQEDDHNACSITRSNETSHARMQGASNYSESDEEYIDDKLKIFDRPLSAGLSRNTIENQLVKNYESQNSLLHLPPFNNYSSLEPISTISSTLYSTRESIDEEDDTSSSSSSSSSSSDSSYKSMDNYKKIINNIKSTLSTTQEIITNFKENNSYTRPELEHLEQKNKIESHKHSAATDNTSTNHFVFKDKNNSNKILEGLNKLRLSKSNYDITLVSNDGHEFFCHKCVLVSFSSYFNAMFNLELAESRKSVISISSLDYQTMSLIIDYAYTSNLVINDNNVQSLLTAANLLDIKPVKDACCRYMEWQMEDSNAIGIFEFSDTHNCDELKKISYKYILANFSKIIEFDEFLSLQRNKLIEIVSDDNLNVANEEIVYIAAIKWLRFSSEQRSKDFYQILEHIRLNLLSPYFLYDNVENEKYLKKCNNCCALVREAITYNLLKDRRNQVQNERTRSRKSFQHLEALIIIGGEDDSVVLRSVDSYFPAIDRWVPLQCSPYALSKHGIVSGEQSTIYMAGGEWPDANPNDTFWQFNSILDDWKELCSLQIPRSELGLTIVDGYVYALGGWTGAERLDSVERYDPLLNSWKYCSAMQIAVSSPGVCNLNGLLYVIGGSVLDGEVTNQVQVYNPSHDEWKYLKTMEVARTGCGSCAFNSKIFALGGWESSNESLNLVESYDPKTDTWESCPSMISCRHKPGVAVLQCKIYVCGGEALFNCYHDSIEAFDVDKQQWFLITLMNSGRSWLSCATLRLQNPLIDTANENNESIKN